VSRVALAMFLNNDRKALQAYHVGDRTGDLIMSYFEMSYFERFGLSRKACDRSL
jgi:hypothetical protein